MAIEDKDWGLWSNVTFKTEGYRRNFDLINDNENFITEYDGTIYETRIEKRLPPVTIGEYGFSMWNLSLGRKFGVDFKKLIREHRIEDSYNELFRVIRNKDIDINNYKKIILVHTFILRKDYRKHGITEEFIEMLYRDFYCEDVAIIILVKPFQNNPIDADFYLKQKSVIVKEKIGSSNVINISATEYYSLNELIENNDTELIEYKLFAIASRCGFMRIDNSYLFILTPEKTIERIKEKYNHSKLIKNS